MNIVSFFGLLTLLFLAWCLSYHKKKVKLRPIFWGMGLQFLLALVILQQGFASFAGMIALGLIVTAYILKDRPLIKNTGPALHVTHGAIALALGAGLYFLDGALSLLWLIWPIFIFAVVNAFYLKKEKLQPLAYALLIASTVAWLAATGRNGQIIFQAFSDSVKAFLSLSDYGAEFMFANLANDEFFFGGNEHFPGFGFQFAFVVLPTIIFFGGFMSVMYYLGIVQKIVGALSHFMRWTMGTSGSETLSCSANVFVGQTEAPLLIKPFIQDMTKSELLTIMVGGFATIAGGVLAGYIGMGVDPKHLIAASVMSAPAALVIAKIIYPEQEHSATAGDVELPVIESGDNVLEAAANGISDGFKLALNVGAMLIGFIALIAVIDVILQWMDSIIDGQWMPMLTGNEAVVRDYAVSATSPAVKEFEGIFPGSLQTLFGVLLSPLAWLMGVPWEDAPAVGNLLGIKLSLNEFVAYANLGTYINDGQIGERAELVATYALCGFANFSSIGIQLGGISSLAPERRSDLAKVVLKAMCGGAIASWTTACIAGMMF